MKQQTLLRKAIAEIKIVIADFNRLLESNPSQTMGVNSIAVIAALQTVIEETLTPLLPEERRVIEKAYGKGYYSMSHASDFFTSNFEQ